MPAERVSMRQAREIARRLGLAPSTVRETLSRLASVDFRAAARRIHGLRKRFCGREFGRGYRVVTVRPMDWQTGMQTRPIGHLSRKDDADGRNA